jgi:hypothetical protein
MKMAVTSDMKTGAREGILVAPLHFAGKRFTRADLVFTGVDHSAGSYEVLVFLNNTRATDTTAHTIEKGYGGRFVIFGHGGCYGDVGHCDVPATRLADDRQLPRSSPSQSRFAMSWRPALTASGPLPWSPWPLRLAGQIAQ